ncbi:hypothetical protein CO057_03680 [Candidatus Uhrbacteria bacterium CG_4_9_14_0_2_um_filter_41_50]|uniref:Uncharacterized protein n=1 Tax=Candidatus Uhrbacteria bacterium CG_4_9_14_0_2_um_filter_41_50 TaxID=1975031 RepID=A0A2M8ENG3_9BACT|nr:MAG: hypothetical protein COZ45_01315 [Candidatus Uhrbacteria bacterium CG_4_10_14_3_um_filter_41_21]PIZ54535.1 MAG: hypothetical protein COY24_03390 [Candidatus Uhrbacteria bacterium CG_4_10_14_0_2_um_filter_41_21]PJB84802.1 MAG: hypothetical protein CO086_01570 [Candidatus Uhrbacteria bacterium CG_4_9_14_0_8_um_filter_41_16]PJC24292.1 MAG: hypothetical protein CO057_03680 [Candidatus Uhrbacteria bacterium CG_4_9_14_0_2_um_filter_41_50]PJE74815.1 MAG: hypothetical protein COV03_03570 [Candi
MQITSPAFEQNGCIPKKYSGQGENINPPLLFSGVPAEAKSLVLLEQSHGDEQDIVRSIEEINATLDEDYAATKEELKALEAKQETQANEEAA